MTPIEILALIIALIAGIKILVLLIKPSSWMKVVEFVYGKPNITMLVSLVLAGAILYYYLLPIMSIVEIFAVMVFLVLLMAISVSAYSKEVIALKRKMLKDKNFVKKAWLAVLVWIILIVWVLYSLFA